MQSDLCQWDPGGIHRGGGVLPYTDYTGMCCWPGYGFQAFQFRTGYINQENNVGNSVYNYIKLKNSLIQVNCNKFSWETYGHVSNMHKSISGFNMDIQFRTGYQNQAKSSLEQGQVSGGPAAHPHQNFCSVPPPPPQRVFTHNWLFLRGRHVAH